MTTDLNPAAPASNTQTDNSAPERGGAGWWYQQLARDGAPADVLAKFATENRLVFDQTPSVPAQSTTIRVAPNTEQEAAVRSVLGNAPTSHEARQAAQMIEHMRAKGASEADIRQAMVELGMDPAAPPSGNDPVGEHLAAQGAKPAERPTDYQLPKIEIENAGEMIEAAGIFREFLHAARFTPEIGSACANFAAQAEKQWAKLDDAGRAMHVRNTESSLQSLFKSEYPQAMEAARQLVREVNGKCGGRLIPWLEETGAGNDVRLVAQVARQAMLMRGRTTQAA